MKKSNSVNVAIPVPLIWIAAVFSVTILIVGMLAFASARQTQSLNNFGQVSSGSQSDASYAGGQYQNSASDTSTSGGGGCGGGGCGGGGGAGGAGGGGGCGSSGGPPKTAEQLNSIKVEAIKYYAQKYGDSKVDGEVTDRGCHMEIIITKNGKPVKYLSFKNGAFSELS